jgi:hypothetical protein
MKPNLTTTRRRVLQQLAAALGAASLSAPVKAAASGRLAADPFLTRALDALLPNRDSAAVIGAAYLRQCEQERPAEILQAKIQQTVREVGPAIDEHALLRRIALDFERGEVVNLQGWLLSVTEARLCALCATL